MIKKVRDLFSRCFFDLFLVSFFVYALAFIGEVFRKGVVTNYVQTNSIMLLCVVSFICATALTRTQKNEDTLNLNSKTSYLFFCSVVVGICTVLTFRYFKNTHELIRILVSGGMGVVVVFLGLLIFKKTNKSTD